MKYSTIFRLLILAIFFASTALKVTAQEYILKPFGNCSATFR